MSGGDRIAIEFMKRWIKRFEKVNVITCDIGQKILRKYSCEEKKVHCISLTNDIDNTFISLARNYTKRLINAINYFSKLSLDDNYILYSSSDFWPDSIPAFYAKLKNPHVTWIAGFYLFAPKPWRKDSPYRISLKRWLIGLTYWLTQLPIYWIVKRYADYVFVTSEPDVKKFLTKNRDKNKIIVIRGGVDIKEAREYLNSNKVVPVKKRKYDAVFVGRFHYQKGVLELIDIWKLVCNKKPEAKLAMIGIGPLENEIKDKIERLELENNIDLLGFKDGKDKYEVFKQSKIVVHPATYDSGGMAACEAMAWGLPGVSFDLEALKTYYQKGMIKTPCYDLGAFAENVIKLLEDKEVYEKTREDAIAWAKDWDWDRRAEEIWKIVSHITKR